MKATRYQWLEELKNRRIAGLTPVLCTLNNPLRFIDPSGLFTIDSNASPNEQAKIIDAYNKLVEALSKLKVGSKAYKGIQRSLARIGKPGVANGVVVTIGKVTMPGAMAQTSPKSIDKGTSTPCTAWGQSWEKCVQS